LPNAARSLCDASAWKWTRVVQEPSIICGLICDDPDPTDCLRGCRTRCPLTVARLRKSSHRASIGNIAPALKNSLSMSISPLVAASNWLRSMFHSLVSLFLCSPFRLHSRLRGIILLDDVVLMFCTHRTQYASIVTSEIVFTLFVCLFINRITENLLNRFSQNSVKRMAHVSLIRNPDHVMFRLG